MNALVELVTGATTEVDKCLEQFCMGCARKMTFDELEKGNLRSDVWDGVFKILDDNDQYGSHVKCLEALRILSRDKTDLNQLVTDERLNTIVNKAGLADGHFELTYDVVIVEALKLLCNIIYHAEVIQIQLPKSECLTNLVKRLDLQNESPQFSYNVGLLFDMRLLFLATAYNTTCRSALKEDIKADAVLIKALGRLSQEIEGGKVDVRDKIIEIACETLKALFNMYIDADDFTDDLKRQHESLVNVLHELLLVTSGTDDLHGHIANLLTTVPPSSFGPMAPSSDISKTLGPAYENRDMRGVHRLLGILENKLASQNVIEDVSPIVTALLNLVKSQRAIRKWVRQQVLPSLKGPDVMHRPEEDPKIRGKLCKLLTSPITEIRDLVAEFLFILCKENVARMIKYTGYGNAAGMFVNKGLLGGVQRETDYSSESGESDTEEYTKYKENINPVTGCYEEAKKDPLEGMTEEQKEHEVMKLVQLVSQLTDNGIIQPCTIGDDGKPRPVQHVLELQKGLPKNAHKPSKNSSDSE